MSKKLTISMLCVLQPVHFLVPGDHPSPLVSITFLIIFAVASKQAFCDGCILPFKSCFLSIQMESFADCSEGNNNDRYRHNFLTVPQTLHLFTLVANG